MKRILSTLVIALVMLTSFTAFAGSKTGIDKAFESSKTIKNYLEFINTVDTKVHKNLFTADFEYVNKANNRKISKKDYLQFLNTNKGLEYNCSTKYEVLDECASSAIAKITMDFGHFIRVDHITLIKEQNDWKISKITTDYR